MIRLNVGIPITSPWEDVSTKHVFCYFVGQTILRHLQAFHVGAAIGTQVLSLPA